MRRTLLIFFINLILAIPCAEAEVFKCKATYENGASVTLNITTKALLERQTLAILSPTNGKQEILKSLPVEGMIEYQMGQFNKIGHAPLIITNLEPFIAFFVDNKTAEGRAVNVRIDGKEPNVKITFYDSYFSPTKVATGSCL